MTEYLIQAAYLAASVLFILGLKSLTRPDSARRGMQQAAVGMVLAIAGTLLHHEIVRYDWIVGGLVVGTVIGIPLGFLVPMTAMPQRIAISHMFGALAATLVGIVEYREAAGAIEAVRVDSGAQLDDIVLQRRSETDLLPPTDEVLALLTGAEWESSGSLDVSKMLQPLPLCLLEQLA